MEPTFPIEFLVEGTPVSHQAKRTESKTQWKERIKSASLGQLPVGHWATAEPIAATLFYFPDAEMEGDLDNIVKPILDALNQHVYIDDKQVQRLVVQKFEPGSIFTFASPSSTLQEAIAQEKPVLYVRISNDPYEDFV